MRHDRKRWADFFQSNRKNPNLTANQADLLKLALACQVDLRLVAKAQESKHSYNLYYPSIKTALVMKLKKLLAQNNFIEVEDILRRHPALLLRQDEEDPAGFAYKGIKTLYQDTLADPLAEKSRTLIENHFPGRTREDKLSIAALQAQEYKDLSDQASRDLLSKPHYLIEDEGGDLHLDWLYAENTRRLNEHLHKLEAYLPRQTPRARL